MVIFLVKREPRQHAEIYEMLKRSIGEVAATRWMFKSNFWLGGCSPVEAIRAGHYLDVKEIAQQRAEEEESAT